MAPPARTGNGRADRPLARRLQGDNRCHDTGPRSAAAVYQGEQPMLDRRTFLAGTALAKDGKIPMSVGIWAANGVMALAAFVLTFKLIRR